MATSLVVNIFKGFRPDKRLHGFQAAIRNGHFGLRIPDCLFRIAQCHGAGRRRGASAVLSDAPRPFMTWVAIAVTASLLRIFLLLLFLRVLQVSALQRCQALLEQLH